MQAILLDIGLILPSILEQVFKVPKGGPFLQLYVTLYNTVWMALTDASPETSCMYVLPAGKDPEYRCGVEATEEWQR